MKNSAKTTIEELVKSEWRLGIYDIIFDRKGNVCLNGLWSNNNNETMNEIARKQNRDNKIEPGLQCARKPPKSKNYRVLVLLDNADRKNDENNDKRQQRQIRHTSLLWCTLTV